MYHPLSKFQNEYTLPNYILTHHKLVPFHINLECKVKTDFRELFGVSIHIEISP